MSKFPPITATLPDYSVEEDKYGRLVNKEKRLVWPSSKQLSQKEFTHFLQNPPLGTVELAHQTSDSEVISPTISSKKKRKKKNEGNVQCLTFHEKYAHQREDDDIFIGATTEEQAARHLVLGTTSFILYYRQEEKTLLTQLNLCMAYRRSNGMVVHFPLMRRTYLRDEIYEEYYWRVETGEDPGREFTSLAALVKYYRLFRYYDLKTGLMEAFPFFD